MGTDWNKLPLAERLESALKSVPHLARLAREVERDDGARRLSPQARQDLAAVSEGLGDLEELARELK
jgi:hypothetical protein